MKEKISSIINESIAVKQRISGNENLIIQIEKVVSEITDCYRRGNKVLFCGNGGSAADAQHLAAELSGRFYFDRKPLDSEALHVNTSYLTAVANDYSFNEVYSRMIEATGKRGDVLVALSTSGNSENILKALDAAEEMGMITIGFSGLSGGLMKGKCRYLLTVPSVDTPRIQESHIMIGHIICELVEGNLFTRG